MTTDLFSALNQEIENRTQHLTDQITKMSKEKTQLETELQAVRLDLKTEKEISKSFQASASIHNERARLAISETASAHKEILIGQRRIATIQQTLDAREATIKQLHEQMASLQNELLIATKEHPKTSEEPTLRIRRSKRSLPGSTPGGDHEPES